MIDANLNRAREGLRVCEEVARFVLEDPLLTRRTQAVRYRVGKLTRRLPQRRFLQARNSRQDVGRPEKRGGVQPHRGWSDLTRANWMRVEEALRVLEELMRLHFPSASRTCARLRFKAYTLEQAFSSKLSSVRHP